MRCETAVAILASEGLALVSVSRQQARELVRAFLFCLSPPSFFFFTGDVSLRTNPRACWGLTETGARPSDARIAIAVSHLIGEFLQISRTLAELHWAHGRRHYDHADNCSSATQELSLRALDLPA